MAGSWDAVAAAAAVAAALVLFEVCWLLSITRLLISNEELGGGAAHRESACSLGPGG